MQKRILGPKRPFHVANIKLMAERSELRLQIEADYEDQSGF